MSVRSVSSFLASLVAVAAAQAAGPSFRTDVMAAISKAGCNLGTCHGNATGKGGFKLSLRGQDLDWDYAALTRDAAGRRVNAFAPDESLLLQKGVNKLAHEGGKRLDAKGWDYAVLRDWIAAGAPRGSDKEPTVVKVEAVVVASNTDTPVRAAGGADRSVRVTGADVILDEPVSEAQITVKATFSDGTVRDVTQQAVYEPLQNGLVEVSKGGLVMRLKFGEPTVLVRYLGQSQPVRMTFVAANPGFVWQKPRADNYIDRQIFAKLKTLRINPSKVCDDAVYVRRVHLDLVGMIPTAAEAQAFVADKTPDKRVRLIDRLMSRPEFADVWALKWADVLKVESRTLDEKGMNAFHAWIRDAIARNRPMDAFVRDLISARGSTYHEPESNFYRANRTATMRGETAAQVFLGTRLQCAQCHNHPFDRWTQDDYFNWAAVFARVDYKIIENKRGDKSDLHEFKGEQVVYLNPKLDIENPRIGDPAKPRLLGAAMPKLGKDEDELAATAKWLTSGANPLFAKAQANRIWYHLMGRGLVDPVDDMRLTNPPSHPKLLDKLAEDFVSSGFDLRHLIRTIMQSRTYQLASEPNETNGADEINYSHAMPRRLSAEQLVDSLHGGLGVAADFYKQPAGTRASQIPGPRNGRGSGTSSLDDESPEVFLTQFGRPKRELACECERANDTSMNQAFQFISGPMINKLISRRDNVLGALLKQNTAPEKAVNDLYWTLLTRAPTKEETAQLSGFIAKAADRRVALEDIAWSLVNAKEFVLRR